MGEPNHEGVVVRIGGQDWIVPPLTFRQLRRLQPAFETLGQIGPVMSEGQIDAVLQIAEAALSRNYPEITRDEVEELLDLGNARTVLAAIAGASGLKPAGEAAAGSRSTGTI